MRRAFVIYAWFWEVARRHLAAARHPVLAAGFAVAIVANSVLMQVWHQ